MWKSPKYQVDHHPRKGFEGQNRNREGKRLIRCEVLVSGKEEGNLMRQREHPIKDQDHYVEKSLIVVSFIVMSFILVP